LIKLNINMLSLVAACALTTACSQIPWDSAAGSAGVDSSAAATASPPPPTRIATPSPAEAAATAAKVSAAPAQPASAVNKGAATAPAAAAKTQEAKEIDPPRPVDLARPADDLWDRIRDGFAMDDLDSPLVGVRERWYASQPDYLKRMVERSKLYLYYIVEEVDKRGMPTEIALLPMVESAFNPMAYSRSHASGLWQFIPSTGKRHQLTQNSWAD